MGNAQNGFQQYSNTSIPVAINNGFDPFNNTFGGLNKQISDAFSPIGGIFNSIGNSIGSAFDKNNHGFLDGEWGDFALSVKRVAELPTQIISENVATFGKGAGEGANSFLTPLSYNPSFYLLAIGGILLLVIGGYLVFKIGSKF